MKKFNRILPILLIVAIFSIFSTNVAYASNDASNDEIVVLGDFDSTEFSYIVVYPENFNARMKLPVVVWSNGTYVPPQSYEDIFSLLAQEGYIVVASTDSLLYDGSVVSGAIDFIIEQNDNPDSPLYRRVDTSRIGAAGHSLGGRSSINAAVKDERIGVVASIAGSNIESERVSLQTPALFFAGENDTVIAPQLWVEPMYDVCQGPAVYVSLKNAGHGACYTDPELYAYYISNWFYTWLYEDQELKEIFVPNGNMSNDVRFMEYKSKGFASEYILPKSNNTSSLNKSIIIASIILSVGIFASTLIVVLYKLKIIE